MIRLLVLALAVYGLTAGYEKVVHGTQACIGLSMPISRGDIK